MQEFFSSYNEQTLPNNEKEHIHKSKVKKLASPLMELNPPNGLILSCGDGNL